jgi:integrase
VGPEVVFGRVRRRAYTPEEFGRLLVGCPAFYRDHFIVQVGTGLRSGELLGLRARRVDLDARRIEVVDVRYDAGRFGRGFKAEPNSPANVRVVPMM